MAYGFNRFLTTHTGSLPRPDDLIRAMFAKEEGVPVDRAALAARIRDAVAEVAKKQVEAGVDLVNDGEMSKPSYATYVKDRLTGFAGSSNTFVYQELSRTAETVWSENLIEMLPEVGTRRRRDRLSLCSRDERRSILRSGH
jgi:methionine synthase II (cobalamin-independent)